MGTRLAFNLKTAPQVGAKHWFDGQEFTVVKVEPYTRRDGQPSHIITWNSSCPECWGKVENTSGLAVRFPRRRCSIHAAPMKRVFPLSARAGSNTTDNKEN